MGYDKDQATEEFIRWSDSYDRSILQWLIFGPSHRVLIRRIREVGGRPAGPDPGRRLRHGRLRHAAARRPAPRRGLRRRPRLGDAGEGPRSRWRPHRGHVFPVQGDSERLPFPAGSFDIVTCSNSFHHYPRQDRAVVEMRRVLQPGGRLMIVNGYRDSLWGWFIFDVCVAAVEGDVHHASARRFRELMTEAGLQAIAQRPHRGLAPFLHVRGDRDRARARRPLAPLPHPGGDRRARRSVNGPGSLVAHIRHAIPRRVRRRYPGGEESVTVASSIAGPSGRVHGNRQPRAGS